MFVAFCLLIIFILILFNLFYETKTRKCAKKFPGPKTLPFVGNGLMFIGSDLEILRKMEKLSLEFGGRYRTFGGSELFIIVSDCKDVEVILSSNKILEKSSDYKFVRPWLGEGLLTSSENRWRKHRKLITPSFHFSILQQFIPIFDQKTDIFIQKMEEKCNGKPFDIYPFVNLCALDILNESAMGVSINAQTNVDSQYVKDVEKISSMTTTRMRNIFHSTDLIFKWSKAGWHHDTIIKRLHNFTDNVIRERRKSLQDSEIKKYHENTDNEGVYRIQYGFLSRQITKNAELWQLEFSILKLNKNKSLSKIYLELAKAFDTVVHNRKYCLLSVIKLVIKGWILTVFAIFLFVKFGDRGSKKTINFLDLLLLSQTENGKLSDTHIREEVDTFMFRGHDTTTSAISFALFLISNHEEVQNKLYKEQTDIFGKDLKRATSYRDLIGMKYLEICIKETLRLYPSVPFIARAVTEDTEINGLLYPEGCNIVIDIWNMNRNPRVFEEPLKFNPERFQAAELKQRNAYSSIPFSAGPRNCIGQKFALLEIKTVISKILRNFILKPIKDAEPMQLTANLVLKSFNGIHIQLQKR